MLEIRKEVGIDEKGKMTRKTTNDEILICYIGSSSNLKAVNEPCASE
jgi:hypothetical protein